MVWGWAGGLVLDLGAGVCQTGGSMKAQQDGWNTTAERRADSRTGKRLVDRRRDGWADKRKDGQTGRNDGQMDARKDGSPD